MLPPPFFLPKTATLGRKGTEEAPHHVPGLLFCGAGWNVVRRKVARSPQAPWADLEEEPGSNLIGEGEKYKYLSLL